MAQPPDAGQILRQQEQVKPRIDRPPTPGIIEPEVLAPPENGVSILVKSINISGGETLENADVLQSLIADAIGQTLGFTQLQQLADRITQHLKAKGWLLAEAYLPKQGVTEGNIQINIGQGKLEPDDQAAVPHSARTKHPTQRHDYLRSNQGNQLQDQSQFNAFEWRSRYQKTI